MNIDKTTIFNIVASSIAFSMIFVAAVVMLTHSHDVTAFVLYLTAAFFAFDTYANIREALARD